MMQKKNQRQRLEAQLWIMEQQVEEEARRRKNPVSPNVLTLELCLQEDRLFSPLRPSWNNEDKHGKEHDSLIRHCLPRDYK